jgi:O-antigen ligase
MNRLVLEKCRALIEAGSWQRVFELSLSLLVGLMIGALLALFRGSPQWQGFIAVFLIAIPFVLLINDPEKIVLVGVAIGVPLNLDVSLIISPYAPNPENISSGHRTIVALTELRVSLVLVLIIIGYALWLVGSRASDRKPMRLYASTSLPALGLILASMLSLFQAQDWQLGFFQLILLIELFLTYLYLANHIRTLQDLQFFITVLMGGMLVESLLMIWQWITGLTFVVAGVEAVLWENPRRVGGTLGGANVAGGILAAYLAIVCAMIWLFPKWRQKVFAVICFVAGSIALVGTGSRSSWIGFVVALLGFVSIAFWRGWVQRKTLVLLVIVAAIIGAIFYPTIDARLTEDDRGSAESRIQMGKLAWNVIQASPSHLWFGVGANNYALVAQDYYTSDIGYLGYVINSSVHNRFLLTWAETGLFGLLFFIGFLAAPLVLVWRHIRSNHWSISLIALGLGCAIVSMSVQMFSEHFDTRPSLLFIWLLISLVAGLRNLNSDLVEPQSSRRV